MGNCKDCKWWDQYLSNSVLKKVPFPDGVGFCRHCGQPGGRIWWVGKPTGRYAGASLNTTPDFGCLQFEPARVFHRDSIAVMIRDGQVIDPTGPEEAPNGH